MKLGRREILVDSLAVVAEGTLLPEVAIAALGPGKYVQLTRDGGTTTCEVCGYDKKFGGRMVDLDKLSEAQRGAAEERLMRAGWKTAMLYELLGTLDRAEWPAIIAERYPGERDYPEACDKWKKEHGVEP